jgi:hypothetical protein
MNKLLCIPALIVLMIATPVNADYRMVVGLEQNSGGGLANDSIVFKTASTPPVEAPTDDYSIFGSYESVARAIVNNKNPVTVMTYENVKDVFTAGYNLNEYKRLQDFGYGYGLMGAYAFNTDLSLSNLINLHEEGYNLIRLGEAAYYIQNVYDMPFKQGLTKITTSYKASCWNTLDEAFTLMDISEWDNYAAQKNCLK